MTTDLVLGPIGILSSGLQTGVKIDSPDLVEFPEDYYFEDSFINDTPTGRRDVVHSLFSAINLLGSGGFNNYTLTGGYGNGHSSSAHTTYATAVDIGWYNGAYDLYDNIANALGISYSEYMANITTYRSSVNHQEFVKNNFFSEMCQGLSINGFGNILVHDAGNGWHIHAEYTGDYKTWLQNNADNILLIPEGPEWARDRIKEIDGIHTLSGDNGNNIIRGFDENDSINGLSGNDTLHGHAGDDNLLGETGNDIIYGDFAGIDTNADTNGNDTIDGGEGDDYIEGGGGNDIINGGAHNDTIHAGKGNDVVDGQSGHDSIYGGEGDDLLVGGKGDDVIYGDIISPTSNDGNDILEGGAGDDYLNGGDGDDLYIAGEGHDVIEDTDGQGSISFGGKILTGGSKLANEEYFKKGSIRYKMDGADLVVKNDSSDEVTIKNFQNGQYGINLQLLDPPEPRYYTTEELNDKWHWYIWESSGVSGYNDPFNSGDWINYLYGSFPDGYDYTYKQAA